MARRTRRESKEQNSKQYDRLQCCRHSYLERGVGVLVSEPYYHLGLHYDVVEVETEFPEINTGSTGTIAPVNERDEQIRAGLAKCVSTCLLIRLELDQHVNRMRAEIERIDQKDKSS